MCDYSPVAFSPIMSDDYVNFSPEKLSMQKNGLDYENYWVQASIGVSMVLGKGSLEGAKSITDCLMGTFARNGYFPRPEYRGLPFGWVSSMDAPVIAVLAQLVYEKTGEIKYQEFVSQLSEYMTKDVSEHGYIAQINKKSWLFEYADAATTQETGWFVLNGSLVGTLGTAMIASVTDNRELWKLVQEQTELYQEMMPEYWYADNSWCYYMLNEPTVNTPHYVIFEIRLFQALADVTGVDFYAKEAQRRIDVMKSSYQLYLYDADGGCQYVFLRGGMPHYYYTDIYDTELVFFAADGTVIKRDRMEGRDYANAWMTGEFPEEAVRVEWNVVPNALWSVNMGELNLVRMVTADAVPTAPLSISYTSDRDGIITDRTLLIRPDYSDELRAELEGLLSSPISISPQDIFAFELENLSEETLSANIVLYDSNSFGMGRYVQSLVPGKNLVTFALPGFQNYGKDTLQDLAFFILRIYTNEMTEAEAVVQVGNFYQLKNQLQLRNLTLSSNYQIKWGEG